ncbi:MAG: hypothetical protein Q4D77_03575 [Peptostreptococcaceae bacterium]|nr:hypothetical protein [Peptostreptococcaceae bacterium]
MDRYKSEDEQIMMDKQSSKILRQFQCDHLRMQEELFAQMLAEDDNVRLFFINGEGAFTDGRNIVVDPAKDSLFCDAEALKKTCAFMGWDNSILEDPWNALHIVTRAQTIHESLHVLYTDFPLRVSKDPRCDTKIRKKTMALIFNIIEDAYIEAVGCSVYDNMEFYLKFSRVSRLFASTASEGTAERSFAETASSLESDEVTTKRQSLLDYLDYMCTFLLYPMVEQEEAPSEIREYVSKTKKLFLDGSMASSPKARYDHAGEIYEIILPLIPKIEDMDESIINRKLNGYRTHHYDSCTIGEYERKGRIQEVSARICYDKEGPDHQGRSSFGDITYDLDQFAKTKREVMKILMFEKKISLSYGDDYECSPLHKDIRINEVYPKIDVNLRKAYQNIYNKYRININSYHMRFQQLLKARASTKDQKHLFGSGISSNRFSEPQKRYWYRNIEGIDTPEIAILLLIDGSGSMVGSMQESAMRSSVILHEVLKKQSISHSIVEHRATPDKAEVDINILVKFGSREEEKYNLMQIDSYGNNRDALTLLWAEKYLLEKTDAERKVIIVLSDGLPNHNYDGYFPPVSTKDTANAVRKIIRRGIRIIAISLDHEDSYECYDQLKEIYPHLIACNDLKRLTAQLLQILIKLL